MERPTLAYAASPKRIRPRRVAAGVVLAVLVILSLVASRTTEPFVHHYRLHQARRLRDDLWKQFQADPRFVHANAGCSTGGWVFVVGDVANDSDAVALIRLANLRRGPVQVDFNCAIAGDSARFHRLLRTTEAAPPTPTAAATD